MGTLLGEPLGGTLLGTSSWLLGTVAWEPVPGNLAWEPLAGNPVPNLAPCRSGCPEGFSRKRKLLPGTFPGTRFPADLAAPTCSGTFTMAEDPKLTLLGEKPMAVRRVARIFLHSSKAPEANRASDACFNPVNKRFVF